jgi:hypothetical protein
METGKTCWGIEQIEKKERQREKGLGRERDNDSGERENGMGWREKMALVDLTVGLNQHLSIFRNVNQ